MILFRAVWYNSRFLWTRGCQNAHLLFRHGQGFFDLAEEIYNISIPRGNNNEELTFGIPEMNKIYQFWSIIVHYGTPSPFLQTLHCVSF